MYNDTRIVALCIARINDLPVTEFIGTLNERLKKENCMLMVYNCISDLYGESDVEKAEASIYELIDYSITDAVIIHDEKIHDKEIKKRIVRRAQENNVPVFTFGGYYPNAFNVRFDYGEGFKNMVRHVIGHHGYRDIHFMNGMRNNDYSDERLRAFKDVLDEYGIAFDDSMVSYGSFWAGPTVEAMEELMKREKLPRCIVCANDAMGLAVINFLKEHDIRIPQDVAVTGFDGLDDIYFSEPMLSSVGCSFKAVADKIADLIIDYKEGDEPKDHFIESSLITANSCGCDNPEIFSISDFISNVGNRFFRFQDENRKLTEISYKILGCKDLSEVNDAIRCELIYNMILVLRNETLDATINPMTVPESYGFDDKLFFLLNSDEPQFEPQEFDKKAVLPNMEYLERIKNALIFTAVNFGDVPLGYTCFFFNNYDIANYCKIPQIVSALNNAIGAFRTLRYQNYLTSQIEDMYKTDNLTGLYNRNGFIRRYDALYEKATADGSSLTVILADLDGLKYINDTFGHDEGDTAIYTVAQALKYSCPEGSVCARFGGDELIAVYGGVCTDEQIRTKLYEYLDRFNASSGKPYKVASSIGVHVTHTGESLEFESLLKKSDDLMYKDKVSRKAQRKN